MAQDLAAYGRDQGRGERSIVPLVGEVARRADRVRLLYLYPSDLTDGLIDAICATGVPTSTCRSSTPPGRCCAHAPVGRRRAVHGGASTPSAPRARGGVPVQLHRRLPGETEDDHDTLLAFVERAQLDWAGFFAYSPEPGTYAADLDGVVAPGWWPTGWPSCASCRTASPRPPATGSSARSWRCWSTPPASPGATGRRRDRRHRHVPEHLPVGEMAKVQVVGAAGPDLDGAWVWDRARRRGAESGAPSLTSRRRMRR